MKKIIEILAKFGLITNVSVDPEKYTSVEDLINKGVITVPGAKEKIMEILKKNGNTVIDVNPAPSEQIVMIDESTNETDYTITPTDTVVEIKEDEIVEVTEVDETEASTEEIVDAVEVVEETTTEEVVTEETPKKKKSTKKAEQAE